MGMPRSKAAALLTLVLVAGACTSAPDGRPDAPDERSRARGFAEEQEERQEKIEARLEALAEAEREGTLGRIARIRTSPAPGWEGEALVHPTADDWEPAIAADPNAPYVYTLVTRFGTPACGNACPDPAMIVRVSDDGGATWGPEEYLCECRRVGSQFDPLIEVVPETGDVYAVWMNDWEIVFSRSDDHGRSWSEPASVSGRVAWADKPAMATSADGQDVYVTFNGPTGGDVFAAASHDGGATWERSRILSGRRYYFAYQGAVAPDSTVTFAQSSFTYTGPGAAAEGQVFAHAISSADGGLTWTDTVVDRSELGEPCTSEWCYPDYYDGHAALAGDRDGDLVILYAAASVAGGPRRVWARASTDGGLTWGPRVALSPSGANAGFPAAVGLGDDEVRVWFMDRRTGRWNTWYRTSRDLGASWSKAVRISDAVSGTVYKDATGFLEAYGDYGEIDVTSAGKTVAIWGEAVSYRGPGGAWFNRQR